MPAPRRSPRLEARANNRKYVLPPLYALYRALLERLDHLDQAYALKDGWTVEMMRPRSRLQEKIDGPAMGLLILACSDMPSLARDERTRITALLDTNELAKSQRDIDDLTDTYTEMLNTVISLLQRIK